MLTYCSRTIRTKSPGQISTVHSLQTATVPAKLKGLSFCGASVCICIGSRRRGSEERDAIPCLNHKNVITGFWQVIVNGIAENFTAIGAFFHGITAV